MLLSFKNLKLLAPINETTKSLKCLLTFTKTFRPCWRSVSCAIRGISNRGFGELAMVLKFIKNDIFLNSIFGKHESPKLIVRTLLNITTIFLININTAILHRVATQWIRMTFRSSQRHVLECMIHIYEHFMAGTPIRGGIKILCLRLVARSHYVAIGSGDFASFPALCDRPVGRNDLSARLLGRKKT